MSPSFSRDQTQDVFEGVSAHFPLVPGSLGGVGDPERIWGQLVTGNYFSVVGARPALGRAFLPEEDQVLGKNPVVVLGCARLREIHTSVDAMCDTNSEVVLLGVKSEMLH